jgi:hypothetical protein
MSLLLSCGSSRASMKDFPKGGSLLIGHDCELESNSGDTGQRLHCAVDTLLDFVAQWAASDREGNKDVRGAIVAKFGTLQHSEVND